MSNEESHSKSEVWDFPVMTERTRLIIDISSMRAAEKWLWFWLYDTHEPLLCYMLCNEFVKVVIRLVSFIA